MREMVRVADVHIVEGFSLLLTFTDGSQKTIDVSKYFRGPIFQEMRDDVALFRSVYVDHDMGTIVWPNGADLDPDVLYKGLTPASVEPKPVKS
jgi:hypothetical protein